MGIPHANDFPSMTGSIILWGSLKDGEEWTLRAIGKRLNISRERVRQLESQAMTHLRRKNSLALALRDYLVS